MRMLPLSRARRLRLGLGLIGAAFLGFIASPLIVGMDANCTSPQPIQHVVNVTTGSMMLPLRHAAHERTIAHEADPMALPSWIDDFAILFLEIAAAFLALMCALAALAVYVSRLPGERGEPTPP